jgi:hypothetical protein
MIKHNKFSSNNIIELEIEREKTRQLELIRDIKKMELRLLTNEKYKKKTKNKYDVFKMFDSLNNHFKKHHIQNLLLLMIQFFHYH